VTRARNGSGAGILVSGAVAVALVAGAGLGCTPRKRQPADPPPTGGALQVTTLVEGIRHPWGLAWLPDGQLLITSRPGQLYTVRDGQPVEVQIDGLPELFAQGQGGLLDIAVHPDDSDDPRVYLTASTGTSEANRVVLLRGRFEGGTLREVETIFQALPDKSGGHHYGSRLVWLPDRTLLMSIGDGGNPPLQIGGMLAREQAQNRQSHLGSVVRLNEDGAAPQDNPFVGQQDVLPELWSYGHRNIQGMARDPETGRIWANEHGPRGGDELNLLEAGKNYGWPLQSQGRDYRTGQPVGEESLEEAVDPAFVWPMTHAPSGLEVYRHSRFPQWQGSVFSGGLVTQDVRRLVVDAAGRVQRDEPLEIGSRVRAVRQGPDGYLYVLTDEEDGVLARLEPTGR
jgi:aldose sugar dehydrogenase